MTALPPRVVLLGPQRFRPIVRDTLADAGFPEGRAAVVTAGWQEREDEDGELREHLQRDCVNLRLYERYEDVLQRDPELAAGLRERQERLRAIQELYRLRLGHAIAAARELLERPGDDPHLEVHRRLALRQVRAIDRHHEAQVREVRRTFAQRHRTSARIAVARHVAELSRLLADCALLLVAGGHVAVLLNRLRLFDLAKLAAGLPVVAWSAGAMAVSSRVVLFHDDPPQGAGAAELLDVGLGVCRGALPLPHARHRLRLEDRVRVAGLARRFAPAACYAMDDGARVDWDGVRWRESPGTRRLDVSGSVHEVRS